MVKHAPFFRLPKMSICISCLTIVTLSSSILFGAFSTTKKWMANYIDKRIETSMGYDVKLILYILEEELGYDKIQKARIKLEKFKTDAN
jgi:hypothetical protein